MRVPVVAVLHFASATALCAIVWTGYTVLSSPFDYRSEMARIAKENRALARGVSLPFGSSVFAIGRKPAP